MKNTLLILPIFVAIFLFSCGGGGNEKKQGESTDSAAKTETKAAEMPSKTSPASGDALTKMQGKWQSVDDAKNIVEIKGNQFIQYYDNNSQKAVPSEIDFSKECQTICNQNGELNLKGANCFTVKGQFDIDCFELVKIDDKTWEYSMIGGSGNTLKFKKI